MLAKSRITNPRYPDSPARMADGRLFTDYRANCDLINSPVTKSPAFGASFDDKQRMQQTGSLLINTDRSLTVMRAGRVGGCVDTMVPELSKRVCRWDGCKTMQAHPAGIGQGRLYLPGRTDLVTADPDLLAEATAFDFGTFSANPNLYVVGPAATAAPAGSVIPSRTANRYSVPYGPT